MPSSLAIAMTTLAERMVLADELFSYQPPASTVPTSFIRRIDSMIDHISVGVSDLERSARFYESALAPLGLSRVVTRPATIGFGRNYPEFWINLRAGMVPVSHESGTHICLRAKATGDVDAFHAAALATGGRSDGAPGLRPHDRVRYYAAFVIDPDGNRIEAVTFPAE